MAIKYWLLENPGLEGAKCVAVTHSNQTYSFEDLLDRMVWSGSTLTRAEVLGVFEELIRCIEEFVTDGGSVHTPLFTIAPSITGVFKNKKDQFHDNRHQVRLRIQAGARLRDMEQKIKVKKIDPALQKPQIFALYDMASKTCNNILTPGRGATISGKQLQFDEADPEQGIFLISDDTDQAIRISSELMRNMPKELIFIVPDLQPGKYHLEIRNLLNRSKVLRTGGLYNKLQVL